MISKGTAFARYSKTLSWIVCIISLVLAYLSFTGDGNNPQVTALLWLGVAIAFGVSGVALGRDSGDSADSSTGE